MPQGIKYNLIFQQMSISRKPSQISKNPFKILKASKFLKLSPNSLNLLQDPKTCSKFTRNRITFEFSSRVNLSGPSLYCIAWTLGK